MWIRTQDKILIQKVGNVFRSQNSVCTEDNATNIKLGIYLSKERAMEVLDQIHQHINNAVYDEARGNPFAKVFQMPKE